MVAWPGFEPGVKGYEPNVLPLHYLAFCWSALSRYGKPGHGGKRADLATNQDDVRNLRENLPIVKIYFVA